MEITYSSSLDGVDWAGLKERLREDDFDNGRTPEQYQRSAENSFFNCFAYANGGIVGNLRVLSDGICNAYIVDVWTYTPYRRRGIATRMMRQAMERLSGQHICLLTDKRMEFYETLGFARAEVAMERVMGEWLRNQMPE